MSGHSPAAVVGCLFDVSASMREPLESGRSDERAGERLIAVLRAALKLAQAEQRRGRNAWLFIGIFGLDSYKCPPTVDLCSAVEALLDGQDSHQTGHELLNALADRHNVAHISRHIQSKFTDGEARFLFSYLQRHPERINELARCIAATPKRKPGSSGVFRGPGAESRAVEHSQAMKLARSLCKDWWLDFIDFIPRPVDDVVNLLQRLQEPPGTRRSSETTYPNNINLLDSIRPFLYGFTPLREAMQKSLAAFRSHPQSEQRVLVIVSDGASNDGDPLKYARQLHQENVIIATVYLTSDSAIPRRRLYDQEDKNWSQGRKALFRMASEAASTQHPIPVLSSVGWQIPSSGSCKLHATVCSATALEEFCSLLLSARFGSADVLLDILGRVQLDAYINDEYVRTCRKPSDQGRSITCYAHAIAAVLHMALLRIEGREGGCPSIQEIRDRILRSFPPGSGGRSTQVVLEVATTWYRPLRFRKVDENGARQAVLRRRPVLTTFRLSDPGWDAFSNHFSNSASRKSVLTNKRMSPYRSLPDGGGHAVVLSKCDPSSLTFLNSWGHEWGNNGIFSVEDSSVLELNGKSGPSRVHFFDIYWLDSDLTVKERQAYNDKVEAELHARAKQHPSILELEARCLHCRKNAPIADFSGNIRQAQCPLCHHTFTPEPGHLIQALYARAGLNDPMPPGQSQQVELQLEPVAGMGSLGDLDAELSRIHSQYCCVK